MNYRMRATQPPRQRLFLSRLRRPQFERPVVGRSDEVLGIVGHVDAHDLRLVTFQRLKRCPTGVHPNLSFRVKG